MGRLFLAYRLKLLNILTKYTLNIRLVRARATKEQRGIPAEQTAVVWTAARRVRVAPMRVYLRTQRGLFSAQF